MPGSTSRWGQQEDPRDNTVDLPRIDVDGLTDYFRRAAPMLEPEPAGLLEPLPDDLRHPYAETEQEPRRSSAWRAVEPPPRAVARDSAPASAPRSPQTPPEQHAAPVPETPPAARSGPAPPDSRSGAPTRVPSLPAAAEIGPAAQTEPPSPQAPAAAEPEVLAERPRPDLKPERPAARSGLRRSAGFGPDGRAPAGSLADLRSRLARLPDGHPSSPYEDDGHARPLPIRLRQLELGLPASGREVVAGSAPDVDADDAQPDRAHEAEVPPADVPAPAADRAETPPADLPAPPAPDARAADEAARDHAASGRPADLTLGPYRATPSPRTSRLESLGRRRANGHGASNGQGNGSRREDTLRPDRPDRAPGDGDQQGTAQHQRTEAPSAALRELAERTLAACRTAEGRNAVGGYGSSGLTPAMQRLAAHLPFGALAPGSEANSLKSSERLAAKLSRLVARNPDRTAEELAAAIGDVVRYAFAFEAADYVEGTWLVHRRLKSHGFELEIRRNRWESPEYKGIFTQWRDPAHDVAFEVQFHTMASWAVVQETHDAYMQITDPATPSEERARLRAGQVTAAAAAKAPQNWAEFGDFRLEAR